MRSTLASLLTRHFWIPAYLALILGFVLPGRDWTWLRPGVPLLLGGILFFTCLRVRLGDLGAELANGLAWLRLAALTAIKLAALPLLTWGLACGLTPAWAAGVLLVSSMPAGMSSAALTDVQGGRTGLALLLLLATSACSPFTVPALIVWLDPEASVPSASALLGQSAYIAALLATPFIASRLVRRWAPNWVQRHDAAFRPAAIACLCSLVLVAALATRSSWQDAGWSSVSGALVATTIAIVVTALCSILLGFWLGRGAAIAQACGALYMNNGLALAFAVQFYPDRPDLVLAPLLVQVPMVGATALVSRMIPQRP